MTNKVKVADDQDLDVLREDMSPVCFFCARWKREPGSRSCEAFAKIPEEIWTGKDHHLEPYPGDGGKLFKKVE